MTRRPTRLYRHLSALGPGPYFTVSVGASSFGDARISSIRTSRGKGLWGLSAGTATVQLAQPIPGAYDATLTVSLTSALAGYISALTGNPVDRVKTRWTGRLSQIDLTDRPRVPSATLTAAHWLSQVTGGGVSASTAGGTSKSVLLDYLARCQLPIPAAQWRGSSSPLYQPAASMPWSEIDPGLTADLGYMIIGLRHGGIRITTADQLYTDAVGWRAINPIPLLRTLCLAPASWSQAAANPVVVVERYRDESYPSQVRDLANASAVGRPAEELVLDSSRVIGRTSSGYAAAGLFNRSVSRMFSLPQVTVDMLMLLASTDPTAHAAAAQLLTIERGDPVALSSDWLHPIPQANGLTGIQIVTDVTEVVTPSEWSITLDLLQLNEVIGGTENLNTTWPEWSYRIIRSTYPTYAALNAAFDTYAALRNRQEL